MIFSNYSFKWRIYPNSRHLTFLMPEVINKISRECFKHEKLNFMRHLADKSNSLYKLFIRSKDQVSVASHTFSICCSCFLRHLQLNTRSLLKESFYIRPTHLHNQINIHSISQGKYYGCYQQKSI